MLTHIDSDHIEGILCLFSQKEFDFSIIKEMWFNFGEGLRNSLKIEGINKEINLYDFDIINQIYNKIDPHPTMKHIKFVSVY